MAEKKKLTKEENRQAKLRRESEARFQTACRELRPLSAASAAILAAVAAMFFVTWADIYNTDIAGAEVSFSGFNCLLAALTGGYSSAQALYGDIAVPFFYYAESYVRSLGVLTAVSMGLLLAALVCQIVAWAKKLWPAMLAGAVLNAAAMATLAACWITARSMNGSDILPIYCSGNPACSIRSYAVVPAVTALAALAFGVVGAVKYLRARRLLRTQSA